MKVAVYGSDLTAWVAAASLAKVGNNVQVLDITTSEALPIHKISALRDEPGLLDQIELQIAEGRLTNAVSDEDVAAVDVHWLALQASEYNQAKTIVKKLAKAKPANLLIINQCNFDVGATDKLQTLLNVESNQAAVYIPDNLQEGKALQGFNSPKRIILGTDSDWALTITKALIRPFSQSLEHLKMMSAREAEFTKFAVTGMLAIRLGYINELANLADELDVDIDIIREGMGTDPRIGHHYLFPGCGFGGQNFQEYISRFSDIFQKNRHSSLLKTVIEQNEVQKELLFRKLWQHYQADLSGKTVTLWGASFKPGTASIDNAPSLRTIEALVAQNVTVQVHDPEALNNLEAYFGNEPLISYFEDPYEAANASDAILLMTEWPEYWSPDYEQLITRMRNPVLLDGRNIFDKKALESYGFIYLGIGR